MKDQAKLEENKQKDTRKPGFDSSIPLAGLPVSQSLKANLAYIYNRIEKELLIARIREISKYSKDILIKCFVCRKERALMECFTCREIYCNKCFATVHGKVILTAHKTISLLHQKEEILTGRYSSDQETKTPDSLTEGTLWRKFEIFSFPTHPNSEFYPSMEIAFKMLCAIYFKESGYSQEIPSYGKHPNPNTQPTQSTDALINNFLGFKNFNIEEKLILNRLMHYDAKKRGSKLSSSDFLRQLKIFQVGVSIFH